MNPFYFSPFCVTKVPLGGNPRELGRLEINFPGRRSYKSIRRRHKSAHEMKGDTVDGGNLAPPTMAYTTRITVCGGAFSKWCKISFIDHRVWGSGIVEVQVSCQRPGLGVRGLCQKMGGLHRTGHAVVRAFSFCILGGRLARFTQFPD